MSDIAPEQESSTERLDRRSIGGSLLLHAGLVAALLGLWRPNAPLEVPQPLIQVILDGPGAAGAAGGGGGTGAAQGSPQAAPQPDAAHQRAAAEPPASPDEPPPAETAAGMPPPPPEPTPAPAAAAIPQPPPPRPARKPAHVARAPAQPKAAAAPLPAPPVAEPTPAPAPSPAPSQTASANPAPGTGGGPGGTAGRGQGVEGLGRGAVGNGPLDGPGDDYLEALRRWLARYKRYPDDAIRKKEEGRVEIGFVLARDGTVLDAWIERSSGVPELDEAALAMMHRASPVPPLPPRYTGAQLKLDIPVDYSIGFFEKMFQ